MGLVGLMAAGLLAASSTGVDAAGAETPFMRLRCDGKSSLLEEHDSLRFLKSGGVSTSKSFGRRRDDERVLFEIRDGAARVHLPPALVTAVHSGDADGWWPVTDLRVGEDAISGRLRINVVNKPSFRIDRVNGDIELSGLMPFRGQCESTAGQERKF